MDNDMEIYLSTQVPEETKVVVPPIDRQPRLEGIVGLLTDGIRSDA